MISFFIHNCKNHKARLGGRLFSPALLKKLLKSRAGFKKSTGLLPEISHRLSSFIDSQESACRNAEPACMELGSALQSVHADAVSLTKQARETVESFGGGTEQSALRRLEKLVEDSLQALKTCRTQVEVDLGRIDAINKRLNDFYGMGAVLQRIAQFLRVVGLNICIESAQSKEANEMFMVNAREIRKFSQEVIDIADNIREDSQTARAGLMAEYDRISASIAGLRGLADNAEKIVQDAFRKIEQFTAVFLEIMEKAGAHAAAISEQVGEIVVNIQFYDNMSQRLEHINRAVHDAGALCAQHGDKAGFNGGETETLTAAHTVIALQRLHLEDLVAELDNVYQKNRQAFSRISGEVDQLAGDLAGPNENGMESHAAAGIDGKQFADLQTALLQLNQLLGQSGELVGQIEEAAGQASETAVRLMRHTTQMKRISHETHLKALNAIVKAAGLGEKGCTIEVLANEIRVLSDESQNFVLEVVKIHDSIVALSAALREESSGAENSGLDAPAMGDAVREISQAFDQFGKGAADAVRRAADLQNAIAHIMDDLEFLPALAAEFSGGLRELADLEQRLSPWADQDNSGKNFDVDELAGRYTMSHERRIHERHFKEEEKGEEEVVDATVEAGPEQAGGMDDDELGDNIELF